MATKKSTQKAQAELTGAATSKAQRTKRADKSKKLSALAAAARVLQETGTPMTCHELIEAMAAKNLWKSASGKTPASTLYSASHFQS